MATLWVRDGYQAEFERKISSYTSKITDISDQYYKASQIVSDYSGDSNVNRKRFSAFPSWQYCPS